MSEKRVGQSQIFVLASVFCLVTSSQEPTLKDIKTLSDKLMVNYSKHIIPSESRLDPFNITVYVSLEAVGDIDEIEEKLSTVLRLAYMWTDQSFQWDLEDTNVSYITLGWSDVWKPVLRVTNPHTGSSDAQYRDRSYETVFFRNTGWAYFEEMMTTRTTCDMDMSYYPFDRQTCEIKMALVALSTYWFKLNVSLFEGFDVSGTGHGSWNLESMNVSSDYGSFVIKLKFERRPLFILVNIILPLFILALLTPVVFLLPKKSGERVGYAVAMLLAISVYMTIVSEHLPHNSNPTPLIPLMIFIWYLFDAVVVVIVIINTKIHLTSSNKPVPRALCKFVLCTWKVMCLRNKFTTELSSYEETQKCLETETVGKNDDDIEGSEGMHSVTAGIIETTYVTWQEVSHAIDKWCFVLSYFIKVTTPIIFFTMMELSSRE